MRSTHVESKIAMHTVRCSGDLGFECLTCCCERVGVGHLKHARHAAQDSTARSGFKILFVGQTRLAEMNLGVDDTWENVQAFAIHHGFRSRARQVTQSGDPSVLRADICFMDAVMVDDDAVSKNGFKHLHLFAFC